MLKKLYVKLLYAVNGIKISKRTLSLFSEGVLIRVLKDIIRFYENNGVPDENRTRI